MPQRLFHVGAQMSILGGQIGQIYAVHQGPFGIENQQSLRCGDNRAPPLTKCYGLRLLPRWQHKIGRQSGDLRPPIRHTGDKQVNHRYDTQNHGDHQRGHQAF